MNTQLEQASGIDNLAAYNGAELAVAILSKSKYISFIRLWARVLPKHPEQFMEARLVTFTMGRDPFILIEKMEGGLRVNKEAKECALVAHTIRINNIPTGDGRFAWELEVLGWWVPSNILKSKAPIK